MKNCPHFECLAYDPDKCSQIPSCTGCSTHSSCDHCNRQETLIEGVKVRCEHIPPLLSQESR